LVSAHREGHELSQSWNRLEARVGKEWLDTMMGKSLGKIGRDRHGKQCEKSVYMGKEKVWEKNWFI
jgi:hypothetical protein